MAPQDLADIAGRHRAAWVGGQPCVLGVLGDFSGRTRDELPPVKERRFHDVRLDTVDTLMAWLRPVARVDLEDPSGGGARLRLALEFRSLGDFAPEALLQRVPLLAEAAAHINRLAAGPERDQHAQALSAWLDALLQAAPVRALDARWRALHRLLASLPDLPGLRVRILDLSQSDLSREIKRYRGTAWDQSPLYRLIVRQELGTWGGQPFNLLLGDYAFSHAGDDPQCLRGLANIAAAADCVFLAAAAPRLLGLAGHGQAAALGAPQRLVQAAAYAPWRALRDDAHAARLALVLPRVLARPPHRSVLHSAGGVLYEEQAGDPDRLPWAHAVYAVGARLFADFALRASRAGLPDAPTGAAITAGASWPQTLGGALEGRFDPQVRRELETLGLIVLDQAPGSDHLRYAAATALAAGSPDDLGWRMQCGRLMHGLRDLARHLHGATLSEQDHALAMRLWLQGFIDTAAGEGRCVDTATPLASAVLQASAIGREWVHRDMLLWQGLAVALQITLPPLRPGRSERCSSAAVFSTDGLAPG